MIGSVRSSGSRHDGPGLCDVFTALDEAQRDQIDTCSQPKAQIDLVLLGDPDGGQRHVRRVDALVFSEIAAIDDMRADRFIRFRRDPQRNAPIVQQQ